MSLKIANVLHAWHQQCFAWYERGRSGRYRWNKYSLNEHLGYKLKPMDKLRKRFRSKYFSPHIIRQKRSKSLLVKIGDMVLVRNDTTRRID